MKGIHTSGSIAMGASVMEFVVLVLLSMEATTLVTTMTDGRCLHGCRFVCKDHPSLHLSWKHQQQPYYSSTSCSNIRPNALPSCILGNRRVICDVWSTVAVSIAVQDVRMYPFLQWFAIESSAYLMSLMGVPSV